MPAASPWSRSAAEVDTAVLPKSRLRFLQVPLPRGQSQYKNNKWTIPETNDSSVLSCVPFRVAGCNLVPSCSVLPGTWTTPSSSVSTLVYAPCPLVAWPAGLSDRLLRYRHACVRVALFYAQSHSRHFHYRVLFCVLFY